MLRRPTSVPGVQRRLASRFIVASLQIVVGVGVLTGCMQNAASVQHGRPASSASRVMAESTHPLTCAKPVSASGGVTNGLITAETQTTDGTRMYEQGRLFNVSFVTTAPTADTVNWSIRDYLGNIMGSGTFPVSSGTQTNMLSCTFTASGYFAIMATLSKAGGTLPRAGTRPAGIATFGVMPDVSNYLPVVTFAHQDQHRFGMQGFNDRARMLANIGVTQQIDARQLSTMEPKGPDTWTPSLAHLDPFYKSGKVMRLVRLDGIPAWASPTRAREDRSHTPINLDYYARYMARVGAETEAIRQAYFPNQRHNYYQVTWEPQWRDSASNLVAMYASVYTGLHLADPHAVVMASASPFPGDCLSNCTAGFLRTYGALGLAKYIDGVSTHSYYSDFNSPSHPPEQYDTDPNPSNAAKALDRQLRSLRAQMQTMKPNMPLWSTELGISYDPGSAYGPSFPTSNQLFAQAAVAARAHLIVLGEGAQVTYFFYGPDYPREVGFGTFFDLVNPQGSYGASTLSPKPEAMAFVAMTRIIDGTQTLGRINSLPSTVYGYSFEQLGGGKVISALWTHNNANWPTSTGAYSPTYSTRYALAVDSPGTSGAVTVFDIMGNPTRLSYTNGVVNLTLTEAPIYVVSSNASVIKANVTQPIGYTGQ